MTEHEFEHTPFCAGDEIVVKKYFYREKEKVEYVNFHNKTINGYYPSEIIEYIKKQ